MPPSVPRKKIAPIPPRPPLDDLVFATGQGIQAREDLVKNYAIPASVDPRSCAGCRREGSRDDGRRAGGLERSWFVQREAIGPTVLSWDTEGLDSERERVYAWQYGNPGPRNGAQCGPAEHNPSDLVFGTFRVQADCLLTYA